MNQITNQTQLGDLLAYAEELRNYKPDYRGKPTDFQFTPEGKIAPIPQTTLFGTLAIEPLGLTDHALKQACQKLGTGYGISTIGGDYMNALRAQDPDLFATNMNRAIQRAPQDGWLVRTYQEDCRAVLGGGYVTAFDNPDILKILNDILVEDGTDHRISHYSFVNVDNMNVDILFGDIITGRGTQFSRGVRMRNGEIGDWQVLIAPVVKKTSCDNSITWDNERGGTFKFKHIGPNLIPVRRVMIHGALLNALPFADKIIVKYTEAEEQALPKFGEVVGGLGFKHGWSEQFKTAVLMGTEGKDTVAGLVDGLTFAAHTQHANPEQMSDMEFLAGAILLDPKNTTQDAIGIYNSRTAREAARAVRNAR